MMKDVEILNSKYIYVMVLRRQKRKLLQFMIYSKKGNYSLGTIKWFGAWRRYCWFPEDDSLVFDEECLRDIEMFLKEINEAYRKGEMLNETK